jgi:Peptidase S46
MNGNGCLFERLNFKTLNFISMRLIRLLAIVFLTAIYSLVKAEEGMWLPLLLENLNEKEMKSMGMKITAKDIYNINKGSLKDAVISFGGFCTAEIVSSQGLVLTNHHCGFGSIQDHSTLDHNYIRDGFWAKTNAEELSNPGLYVTFIVMIEDVSKQALGGITADMKENERQSAIDKNINEINRNTKKESYQKSFVKAFFEGNQYYLFVTETYDDVRLVGAPPSSIGNFGQDTDNWIWPRHTGDFSVFRIYANKENKPASYSPDNIPYVPKRSLSISMDGVTENGFTMVFGFPGTTNEYLYSAAVEQIMNVNDPAKVGIRDKALSIMSSYMRKDEQIKIQYASKYAGISNSWKKWKGEMLGLTRSDAVIKKRTYEAEFQKRVNANPVWKSAYANLLSDLGTAYTEFKPYTLSRDYFNEVVSRIELFNIAAQVNTLLNALDNNGEKGFNETLPKVKEALRGIYTEYNAELDKSMFASLMEMFVKDQDSQLISADLIDKAKSLNNDFTKLADEIYNNTDLDEGDKTLKALDERPTQFLIEYANSKIFGLYADMVNTYLDKVSPKYTEIQDRINKLQRTYMQAQMEVFKEKRFYPDANRTMRITYGKVKGYNARDAVKYDYYTYLDGVMQKYIPGDYEFDLPQKLMDLYAKKDYGQYGKNGKMPVCFIATNHTTGGNSGSPALDAYGNLVGLNFDRVWEGTMSDINYDPSICRNIMVDIRYVLFIIDKYAGAGNLVKEMKLVHPKGGK